MDLARWIEFWVVMVSALGGSIGWALHGLRPTQYQAFIIIHLFAGIVIVEIIALYRAYQKPQGEQDRNQNSVLRVQDNASSQEHKRKDGGSFAYLNSRIKFWLWLPIWLYNLKPIDKFTGVLTVIASLQVCFFIQSERAFVFPTNVAFASPLVHPMPGVAVNIDFENSGKSPATVGEIRIVIGDAVRPPQPIYGGAIKSFLIPPLAIGGEHKQYVLLQKESWGAGTVEETRIGKLGFYIYGVFNYSDGFTWIAGERKSQFCFQYVVDPEPSKAAFRTCPEPEYTYIR